MPQELHVETNLTMEYPVTDDEIDAVVALLDAATKPTRRPRA
jgi:hypothetical protein